MIDQELRLYPLLSSALKMWVPQGSRTIACGRGCGQYVIMAPDGVTPLEHDNSRGVRKDKVAVRPHLPYCRAFRNDRRRA